MYRPLSHAFNRTASGSRQTLNSTMSGSRQTLNSTTSGSTRSLNSTTLEKNPGLVHLKCALIFINDNIEEVGLEQKLKLEDFSRLTSEQLLKMVTFLLQFINGEKHIHENAALPGFRDFKIGTDDYDCGIDQIYHAIKTIFPPENDLFHYSVLLMPSADPKRTKGVISYIMSFVLMCDKLRECFAESYKEIIDEIEEEQTLYGEVETLRNNICDKIQQRAVEINQVPVVKAELQKVSDLIARAHVELAKCHGNIETLTGVYQKEETKIQRLNEKLQKIEMELADLQQCIVNDPNPMLLKNETVKKQFQAESERREELAGAIEQLGKEREAYEDLNQRAKNAAQSLEVEVSRLVDIRESIDSQIKTVNDTLAIKGTITHGQKKLDKLKIEFEGKSTELQRTRDEREKQLSEIAEENKAIKGSITDTERQINLCNNTCSEVASAIDVIADQIEKMKELIVKYIEYVNVRIPQLKNQHIAEAEEWKDKIAANFCNYPEL